MAQIKSVAGRLRTVTPSNTMELSVDDGQGGKQYAKALYVGVSGNLNVLAPGDTSAVLLENVPVGWHPIEAKKVLSTSTTASKIVAAYE